MMPSLFRPTLVLAFASLACGGPAARSTTGGNPAESAQASQSPASTSATGPRILVHKTPTCGCCADWVKHLQTNGFDVAVHDMQSTATEQRRLGVPGSLQACHTAEVDGYVIEGHVPADLIRRLLNERPQIAGLAVAGMPAGSPGMEMGYKQPYEVIAFNKNGRTSVYATR
jgi:hypothetical protein